ncbi:unnamed protein product [Oppiella nova]|uniref:mitogen-activated protein kinase kinase n=1 Tax=Oppiella nova TaxID=334625 RepID=A0A7R9QMU3_9ACAR|nr:unnamed protein product [Oppiella nova]CAG2168443.1 unnamed protein product [Oppiella nova]
MWTNVVKLPVPYYPDTVPGNNLLFVTFDDRVYGLGSNRWGQLGLGHNKPVETPQQVPELYHKNILQFINGKDFVLAVTTDNQIYSFGRNHKRQLVRCGDYQTFVLTNSGHKHALQLHVVDRHIIHRDLTPANVLITRKGNIKLCDLALAKDVYNCDPFRMSKAKHTADVGAVDYMAPEAQTNEYNHLSDIYSLSLIGAQIFGFDTKDIISGRITNVEKYNLNINIIWEKLMNY